MQGTVATDPLTGCSARASGQGKPSHPRSIRNLDDVGSLMFSAKWSYFRRSIQPSPNEGSDRKGGF